MRSARLAEHAHHVLRASTSKDVQTARRGSADGNEGENVARAELDRVRAGRRIPRVDRRQPWQHPKIDAHEETWKPFQRHQLAIDAALDLCGADTIPVPIHIDAERIALGRV